MTLLRRKTVIKANKAGIPTKMRDKIYMIYAMSMICEGLCLDTKQMEAHEICCKMRERTKQAEEHGELADSIYEIYKRLNYLDITLLPHLLYLIAKESKKLKSIMLNKSPLSNYVDEELTREIEKISLKYFLNFDIVKQIEQLNINILNGTI